MKQGDVIKMSGIIMFPEGLNLVPEDDKVRRCALIVGVELNGKINWIGKDLQGADLNFSYNESIIENIFCETNDQSTIGNMSMTLDPFSNVGTGDEAVATGDTIGAFQVQLMEGVFGKDLAMLKAPAILAIKAAGANAAWRARRWAESTWKPQSLGGSGADKNLKFPIDITFAGAESVGTVDKLPPEDLTGTFTADVSVVV